MLSFFGKKITHIYERRGAMGGVRKGGWAGKKKRKNWWKRTNGTMNEWKRICEAHSRPDPFNEPKPTINVAKICTLSSEHSGAVSEF